MPAGSWREHLATIRPDGEVSAADWWDTSWEDGSPAAVGFLVPRGFEAYARVLHPADRGGEDVRWGTVAEECGTTLHPEAQWWRLAGRADSYDHAAGWPGGDPDQGLLGRTEFTALAEVLAGHTGTTDETFVAFWSGYGLWPRAWLDLPQVRRPGREHLLFRRALSEVEGLCAEAPAVAYALGTPTGVMVTVGGDGRPPTADEQLEMFGRHQWQSPTEWWPADHAWATSNDTDLDSTLVGGSHALVVDLLADPRLEVLPWPQDGSLWADADRVNA